jgi:hypothetical protein
MANFRRVMLGIAVLSVFWLYFCLGTTGQEEQKKKRMEGFLCGDKTLKVDQYAGVDYPIIYICADDPVTLDSNNHTFKMSFKDDQCPFVEGCNDISTTVSRGSSVKKTAKGWTKITFIKYSVSVDGNKPIDPVIIGGGRHGYEDTETQSSK